MCIESDAPLGDLTIQDIAMPADTNANGDIFGGWLISQMDLAAGVLANRTSNGRAATVAIDKMCFHQPVKVGNIVSCYAELLKIGKTSMTIKVEAWAMDHLTGFTAKVTEGTFVFVAIDENGNSRPVKEMLS
jgi:acyl-CoA thioesterase YciA